METTFMKQWHRQLAGYGSAILIGMAVIGQARATTIRFDELPAQDADGLSFAGVTFGFQTSDPAGAATFGGSAPGGLNFVRDEVLEGGTSGELTLTFDQPQRYLAFGLALSVFIDLSAGATVQFYDESLSRFATQALDTRTLIDFSEGFFEYSAGAAFSQVVVTFNVAADRFALDNLTFQPVLPVPDSLGSVAGNAVLALVIGIGVFARSRR
jgi:hypothetical protein